MALVLFLSCLYICASVTISTSVTNSSNQSQATTQPQHIESLDIVYPLTNISFSDYDDCSLSLQLNLISTNKLYNILSSNTNLQNTILYWLHSHIFLLIDTSFVHKIDTYTNDFWNEYYLHLITISNQTQPTITLSINICIDQIEIKTIIQTELNTDGDEIAAFIKHKLSDYINTNYKDIIIDNLSINIIKDTTPYMTTTDKISHTSSININTHQTGYMLTEQMIYVAIIGVCMIIMALIVMVYIILCIKNRTSLKLEQAIKDIKTHQNNNNKHNINQSMNFAEQKMNDIISIDPIHINIPTHLVSIDTGLNRENILEEDDGNESVQLQIECNKLPNQMNNNELEELKLNIDDILIQNKNNKNKHMQMQSLSARNINQLQKMNIIEYNRTNSKSLTILRNNNNNNKNKQIRKYRNYPQRHSVNLNINTVARKQYAKRKVIENKRSQSKPNILYTKSKQKLKLKPSHSNNAIVNIDNNNNNNNNNNNKKYRNSAAFPLQYNSNSMHNVFNNNNNNIKNRRKQNNKSVRSLHLNFDINDKMNLNINNIPQPNSKSIDDNIGHILNLNNDWESEPSKSSTNGIIIGTPTTKGNSSQLDSEGNSNDNMSNSDAQSDMNMNINDDTQSISTIDNNYNKYINKNINVYKILELNKERVTLTQKIPTSSKNIPIPPPPPAPPIIKTDESVVIKMESNDSITIAQYEKVINNQSYNKKEGIINMYGISRNNSEETDLKFDALSMIAINSNHSRCQPNF